MFARKGTRKISINGDIFLWRVAAKTEKLRLVVQRFQETGQILIFSVPYSDPWLSLGLESSGLKPPENQIEVISPSFVKKIILFALENGWTPETKRTPYYLTLKNSDFITK